MFPTIEGRSPVPLFMDVHEIDGRYWVDEGAGRVFCLVEAPSAEAAANVHREAHGLVADHIYRVQEGS